MVPITGRAHSLYFWSFQEIIIERRGDRTTDQSVYPKTDFEHCTYVIPPTHFRTRQTYRHIMYHAKSRLNTPVWGSLRSPNYSPLCHTHYLTPDQYFIVSSGQTLYQAASWRLILQSSLLQRFTVGNSVP